METLENIKYEDLLTLSINDLASVIEETFEISLKEKSQLRNWEIKGDLPKYDELRELLWKSKEESTKSYKRVCKAIKKANQKKTRRAFNSLFYRLGLSVKVDLGSKEKTIQTKKKAWKEAQTKAEQLLKEYKEEKGDFYKKM